MRQATDPVAVDDGLVRVVMASTDLTEEEVRAGLAWVDEAIIRSRFNMYHQLDRVVRHIGLAVSVSSEDLGFSLEAHGFQPLPADQPTDRMLVAIKAILVDEEALRKHVESLPTL